MTKTHTQETIKPQPIPLREIGKYALVAGGLAVAGIGAVELNQRNTEPSVPALNGPTRVVIVGEEGTPQTAWGIAQQAYPDLDPRVVLPMIRRQLPEADQKGYVLRSGERIIFNEDAKIGDLVQPPSAG